MADRHDDLVTALQDLGARLDMADPANDPVAVAVRRITRAGTAPSPTPLRLAATGGRPLRAWRRPRPVVAAVAALAVAIAAVIAVPGSRAAVARLLGIGGVRVVTTRDVPAGVAGPYVLGEPIAVDRALAQAPAPMVPDGVGDPLAAFAGRPEGAVTLVWAAGGELPELVDDEATGLGLIVTAFPDAAGAPAMAKEVSPATRVEAAVVGGRSGYWISGAPHEVHVLDPAGEPTAGTVRLTGNTLIWTDGATTYRLESALERDRAIEVAERIPGTGD